MFKFAIVLCAVLFASVESAPKTNSPNTLPDISEIDQKFKVADEKYRQIDDESIFNVIPRTMKEVHAEIGKLDTDNPNYVTFNCSKYVKHLFDTVNHIFGVGKNDQCIPTSLKIRFHHVETIYKHFKTDLNDFKDIKYDVIYCHESTCAEVIEKEKNQINTMYHQVFPNKITALNSLMTTFIKSATYCTMSSFPELQNDYSTAVDNTRKCIEQ